jgi:hypothetical protein
VQPPSKTSFDYYYAETKLGEQSGGDKIFADRPAVVQGEAATVDFRSAHTVDRKDNGST